MIFRKPEALRIQIEAKIQWQFAQDPESKVWIGVCPALNLNAEGETFADLLACSGDALMLLFKDLFEQNELDRYLSSRGWRPLSALPSPGTNVRFDAPFDFERLPIESLATATA